MQQTIKTSIIPINQQLVKIRGQVHEIDHKAICLFAATGFFWDDMTYFKDQKVLRPGTVNKIDDDGFLIDSEPWFNWYYKSADQSFQTSVEQHKNLLEQIIGEQVQDNNVILPLSGGLDSRSQAVALKELGKKVTSYSYSFKDGYKEHGISQKIAEACNFDFQAFEIPYSYLWNRIDELAEINQCYSEFTHPRQMAVLDQLKQMDGIFSLGHWGDVLFDTGGDEGIEDNNLVAYIHKKVVKKGGMELAQSLWKSWDLDGSFEDYMTQTTQELLAQINIENTSAKVRAFKSTYWAPRWTSINLSVFEAAHPITLPYYDDRMCQLICEIPEDHLADRKLQIEYIKQTNPEVAKITWQDQKPFNLFNYHKNRMPLNLPYRVTNKLKRVLQEKSGKKYVQRNWELQFLGEENKKQLESYLFRPEFANFIDSGLVKNLYQKFENQDQVWYSHAISMLLTLSVWQSRQENK
ncbi:MAG: asparagine synthase-related protein [Nonlabens sp.]